MRQFSTICAMLLLISAALPVSSRADSGAAKKSLNIVTSFYPIYISVLNVVQGADGVQVSNLTKPATGCLHDYQLSPQDLKVLSRASVFVINGAGMESFLEKVAAQYPGLVVIDASKGIKPLVDLATGQTNSHIWVSISNAAAQVINIEQGLAMLDPGNEGLYRSNAEKYAEKLRGLQERMRAGLEQVKDRRMITFHEAFAYFAAEFGLEVVAVIEREPGAEPNAREMAATIELIRRKGVQAIFAEPQYPAKSARIIAQETGAQLHTLDPAASGPVDRDAYIKIMESNLVELQDAFGAR